MSNHCVYHVEPNVELSSTNMTLSQSGVEIRLNTVKSRSKVLKSTTNQFYSTTYFAYIISTLQNIFKSDFVFQFCYYQVTTKGFKTKGSVETNECRTIEILLCKLFLR